MDHYWGIVMVKNVKVVRGTRFSFYQEYTHEDYLLYLHSLITNLGYCNLKILIITTRLGLNGKVRKIIRFHTWTYNKFNTIHNEWYGYDNKKIVLRNLEKYLSLLALSIWIMDDGCKVNSGLKFATNCFSYDDHLYLIKVLQSKYNLKCSIIKAGFLNQYNIYIWKESMLLLYSIVKLYIILSMKYKVLQS